MQKSRIEWTDYTFNPVKGLCPVGCHYCYARKMYKRFGWNPQLRYQLADYQEIKKPSKIFVCSTMEMFHPDVPKYYRDAIFNVIQCQPQHTFQILTKLPQNIDRPMPDNVWLGVSIGDDIPRTRERIRRFIEYIKRNEGFYFLSIEPFLWPVDSIFKQFPYFNWVILGRLTGHGKQRDPHISRIQKIVNECQELSIPIFLKDNLKDIWGKPLIQEFPE